MDSTKQREIARKGGRAAHAKGTAHEFTPDEARAAGRKGGEAVSRNREHMAEIGRRGGERRGAKRAALRSQTTDTETTQPRIEEQSRGNGSGNGAFSSGRGLTERIDREYDTNRDRDRQQ